MKQVVIVVVLTDAVAVSLSPEDG